MPLGILNLCAHNSKTTTENKYSANITAKKLGFDSKERKTSKVIKLIDAIFPTSSFKNDEMRKTITIGLISLKEAK